MKAWFIVLLFALAGCAEPETQDPTPNDPNDPGEPTEPTGPTGPTGPVDFLLDYRYEDCTGTFFASNHEATTLQPYVPSNYTASTQLLAVILECGNFTTPEVYLPGTWFGFIGIQVNDPGYGGSGNHIYVTEMLAEEDVLAQLWDLAGYETINGTGVTQTNSIGIPVPLLTTSQSCLDAVCFDTTMDLLATELITDGFTLYHESEEYRLQWTGTFDMQFDFNGAAESSLAGSTSALAGAGQGWFGSGDVNGNNLIAHYP